MDNHLLSADELLQRALIELYSEWYNLPRRSTVPELDELRLHAAGALAALPVAAGAVPRQALEQILVEFGLAVLELPRCDEYAGEALRDLTGPTLKTNIANSSARVDELLAWLRTPEPFLFVLGKMQFTPARAEQAWTQIWSAVKIAWDRLPAEVRNEAETVDQRLQRELEGANWLKRPGCFVAALAQLESMPTIVRAAWREFRAAKECDPVTYRSAPPPPAASKSVPPAGQGVSEGDLEGFFVPDEESSRDLKPVSEATPTNLFTDVQFPSQVKPDTVHWLTVQLRIDQPETTRVTGQVPLQFAAPAPGALPDPEIVDVRLNAPGFSEETGIWERTITVYPTRDSVPAVFLLKAHDPGQRRLIVDFFHKGRMLGTFSLVTTVGVAMATRSALSGAAPTPGEVAPFDRTPPPPADLVVRIVKDVESNRLNFTVHSDRPEVGLNAQPAGAMVLTAKDPQAFFTQRFDRLSQRAAGGAGDRKRIERDISKMGEGLFELLPDEFREIYWKVIKPQREAGKIATFLIISDEPWIPWELMKPYRFDLVTQEEEEDGFWVERFETARWLAGFGPGTQLSVERVTLIMPELDLTHVQEERQFFARLQAERGLQVDGPLQERNQVLDSIEAGGFQLLHFATHGNFVSQNADESELSLVDGSLSPSDVEASGLRGLRKSRPLVFLNACYGARTDFGLTGLGGWVERLVGQAHVSAFVGALWEVNDELAVAFSTHFYERLLAGDTVAQAFRSGRLHIRDRDPANPTWLAYALYADPNARVVFGKAPP
ncbi:MAG: CHAT domain-containing protein [Anaerolineales bacterium]|nr:CHAT domain-containing protein [Anaerolineales bacterium]